MAWAYADQVISALGLVDPADLDVDEIARTLDADVIDADLADAEAQLVVRDGGARPLDLRARIRVSRSVKPAKRRFSIAHELGHFVLQHAPRALAELVRAA